MSAVSCTSSAPSAAAAYSPTAKAAQAKTQQSQTGTIAPEDTVQLSSAAKAQTGGQQSTH